MFYNSDLPNDQGKTYGLGNKHGTGVFRQKNNGTATQQNRVLNTEMSSQGQATGPTKSLIVGRNDKRNYLLLQNVGAVAVYISLGADPRLDGFGSIILNPTDSYAFDNGIVPVGEVWAISQTSGAITVVEGVKI